MSIEKIREDWLNGVKERAQPLLNKYKNDKDFSVEYKSDMLEFISNELDKIPQEIINDNFNSWIDKLADIRDMPGDKYHFLSGGNYELTCK